MTGATGSGPLAGRRVLVTREQPGELGRLLTERAAEVVHVPLIATTDPADGGAALRVALDALDTYDWLVVTSAAGAERVGDAARRHPEVRLAAVGTTTARVLADLAHRPVDLVPARQLAAALATDLIAAAGLPPARILVAQADRADGRICDALLAAGHDVTTVIAYATVLTPPDPQLLAGADALLLASGSAAVSWVDAVGPTGPDVIVAIGPSTAAKARQLGLKVSGVAADHTIEGLVGELVRRLPRSDT